MMTLLTDWGTAWLMTGMGIGIVFCILVILVLILNLMGRISASTTQISATQANTQTCNCGCAEGKPSDDDLAAVATAVQMYLNDQHDLASGVLTWHPHETAWHSELNPTL